MSVHGGKAGVAIARVEVRVWTQTGLQPCPTSSYYDAVPWKNRAGVVSAAARRVDRLRNRQAALFDAYYKQLAWYAYH
jgi:hypothetical protein